MKLGFSGRPPKVSNYYGRERERERESTALISIPNQPGSSRTGKDISFSSALYNWLPFQNAFPGHHNFSGQVNGEHNKTSYHMLGFFRFIAHIIFGPSTAYGKPDIVSRYFNSAYTLPL